MVHDRYDIGGHVRDHPRRHAVRLAVPGPVEADQPYPEFVKHPAAREWPDPAPRCPMQVDHRLPGWVTGIVHGKLSAVGRVNKNPHFDGTPSRK
jgi:hypothetical protein